MGERKERSSNGLFFLTKGLEHLTMASMTSPLVNAAILEPAPSFELRFRPSAILIPLVRGFVEEFYMKVMDDRDVASRLALTTHELLENAAKYSSDGDAAIQVQVLARTGTVYVRASNHAAPAQIALLRKCFDEIGAAPDARELYARMLKRTAVLASGSGGLGLARIWAESEMAIRLEVTGDQVAIHAEGPIAPSR
jgi:hypothetical protein